MTAPRPVRFADLGRRAASGVALALVALLNLWAGGYWALAFVVVFYVLMLWEYHRMVTGDGRKLAPALVVASVCGAVALYATMTTTIPVGLAVLAAGSVLLGVVGRPNSGWLVGGFLYMGLAMGALLVLRARDPEGAFLLLWLVLVVVAADVGAYFVGRRLGGPKLWVQVSPGKTWSGAIGGLFFAALAGALFTAAIGADPLRSIVPSVGIAIFSQLGDLLESAVKRRFGIKDASQLIPGHGGVMDRLDGIMGGVWFFGVCDALGLGVDLFGS